MLPAPSTQRLPLGAKIKSIQCASEPISGHMRHMPLKRQRLLTCCELLTQDDDAKPYSNTHEKHALKEAAGDLASAATVGGALLDGLKLLLHEALGC